MAQLQNNKLPRALRQMERSLLRHCPVVQAPEGSRTGRVRLYRNGSTSLKAALQCTTVHRHERAMQNIAIPDSAVP